MRLNHENADNPAFTRTGFNRWNRSKDAFDGHEKSAFHRHSVSIAKRNGQNSFLDLLNTQNAKEHKGHRKSFFNEIRTLIFLASQALPTRGHEESERNLRQLLATCLHEHEWVK